MTHLSSMTGFARVTGAAGPWRYAWEIKTVNGRGLDIRVRVPAGFDAVGEQARRAAGETLKRGNVQISLNTVREENVAALRVNEAALQALVDALARLHLPDNIAPASLDGLLAVRGIVDTGVPEETALPAATEAALMAAFGEALTALSTTRQEEGAALTAVLREQIARISELAARADSHPARTPEAVRARLAAQVAALLEAGRGFDPGRLHQEAVLLAAKADIREEIDRLHAHVAAARTLLEEGAQSAGGSIFSRRSWAGRRTRSAPRPGIFPFRHRPRPQGRGRAVPRTGAECRVSPSPPP